MTPNETGRGKQNDGDVRNRAGSARARRRAGGRGRQEPVVVVGRGRDECRGSPRRTAFSDRLGRYVASLVLPGLPREFRLAASRREDLVVRADQMAAAVNIGDSLRRILGRSLRLRQVSAGGCNACEADTNVLNTVGWDLGRFGLPFVASPSHADGLLITGPVTANMRSALEKTYQAVPDPKIVIAVGACAISGGPYRGHPETHDGAASTVPVDVFVPGCPPHPLTILQALLDIVRTR